MHFCLYSLHSTTVFAVVKLETHPGVMTVRPSRKKKKRKKKGGGGLKIGGERKKVIS